jgi:predicted transcriptional regulator of viral defense system
MTLFHRLAALAAAQHGYVTVDDARDVGGTPMALLMLAKRGTLEHVDHGLYRFPDIAVGPLAQFQEAVMRVPGAVLSHDTALELLDLADVNPRKVHVTAPRGYRVRKRLPGWLVVHHDPLDPMDATDHEGLPVVTPARAIIDAIRDNLGPRFVEQALDTARRRNLLTTPEERRVLAVAEEHRRAASPRGAS